MANGRHPPVSISVISSACISFVIPNAKNNLKGSALRLFVMRAHCGVALLEIQLTSWKGLGVACDLSGAIMSERKARQRTSSLESRGSLVAAADFSEQAHYPAASAAGGRFSRRTPGMVFHWL